MNQSVQNSVKSLHEYEASRLRMERWFGEGFNEILRNKLQAYTVLWKYRYYQC